MRRSARIAAVLALALICGYAGCESSDGSATSGDAGPDMADAGADCDELPSACQHIGDDPETQYFGCCFQNVVYWCDEGEFLLTDCTEGGNTCAYNSQLEAMWCM